MPTNSSPALPELQLSKAALKVGLLRKTEPVENTPEIVAAAIFDEAVERSRETNKSIGARLGVHETLVMKWRSPHYREFPSLLQVQKLGPDFLVALNRASSRHNGLGRRTLAALLDACGDLAVAVGE